MEVARVFSPCSRCKVPVSSCSLPRLASLLNYSWNNNSLELSNGKCNSLRNDRFPRVTLLWTERFAAHWARVIFRVRIYEMSVTREEFEILQEFFLQGEEEGKQAITSCNRVPVVAHFNCSDREECQREEKFITRLAQSAHLQWKSWLVEFSFSHSELPFFFSLFLFFHHIVRNEALSNW